MTIVSLSLGCVLWRVKVPAEIENPREQMIWAQGFAAGGGLSLAGWQAVIRQSCPGIGWTGPTGPTAPAALPFGVACVSDRLIPDAPVHSPIRRPPPPPPSRHGSDAESGNGALRRPVPQRPTSSASRLVARALAVVRRPAREPAPKPAARPHTVGWMGSTATNDGGT